MKKIITLLMLTFIVSISYAQYTPMTAAGYQFKRILCDSTLHIPSFCGIPTLRNSTAKNGAIAMDTCSGKFYMWTNLAGWSQITGVGTDTTSLSNRIDQRVKYTDTAAMLTAYLRKQDTANKFVANVTKVNDSTIRVFKGSTITDLKILGKGTDTNSLSARIDARVKYTDTSAMLLPYLRKTDTTAMLSKYLRKTDTASLSNRINLKVNISDTATMLSKYLRKTDTASLSNRINLKVNISDTATMLSKYLRKTDTSSLSNRINLKLNIADTTNKWVSNVTKKNDSTITIFKGTSATDITLPRGSGGGGGSQNLQQVTDIGNTTTHELIVDDGIVFNEKLGLTDYGNNIVYPLRYTNVFQGAIDIIDSMTTYPPTIFGYNNTSTNPSYKIGYNSGNGKPFIDFIGVDSKLKITDEFISFSDNGIAITKLQPIPNGNSDIHYLPQNDGADDTLLIQAPQDGQYYAQQNGGWVSFSPSGGGISGSGTTNYVPKWSSSSALTNSLIYDDGTSIGIDDITPTSTYKLNVNGITRSTGFNTSDGIQNGIYGITNGLDYYLGNNKVGTYKLNGVGAGSYFEHTAGFTNNGTATGTQNIWRLSGGVTAITANNTMNSTQLLIDPTYNQSTFGQGALRGIYYNPTITALNTSKNIAFESTSGNIIFKDIKKSSTTTDSIAVFINDTLTKAPYPVTSSQNGRFGNDTANVILAKIHNNTGAILTNGKVVALSSSGTNADAPSVRLANNKHDSTSANTLGFVTGSIAINDTGWVIISGKIEKLNTSAFSNGDIIYLDSVSGEWTKTKPVAPYHMVYLGVVIKANAGNGSIFVKCQNGYELDEIHDVQITGKANNQVLAYSDTQKVWKNRNIYSIVDTTSLSSRINLKLNISDTSVFQRKSLSSYTVMANNTNATANATAQTYRDVAEQNMTNTITWSSGTAPSTLTSANYSWSQIGKTVTFIFNALYVNAATSITGMFFDLPSDLPTPAIPTGWTGASGYLYTGTTTTHLTATAITNTTYPAYLRRNAANTAYEVGFTGTSSARGYKIIITYRTQ